MRSAVWFSSFGLPNATFSLPYSAQSPTLYKRVEFKKETDILAEIDRILEEIGTKKYGIGQSLFYQLPLFCDPFYIIPDWCWGVLDDYQTVKNFNIPLSNNLDDVNMWTLDCFKVIQEELTKIEIHRMKKDGS